MRTPAEIVLRCINAEQWRYWIQRCEMTRFQRVLVALVLATTPACGAGQLRMPSAAAPPDDNTIAVRVRTSLANAPAVHASGIQVEVAQGVVVLKGAVPDQSEVTAAIAAARAVSGVKDVKSELKPAKSP